MAKAMENYRGRSEAELRQAVADLKKELFNLRFQKAAGELANTARFKEVRRNVARAKTELTRLRREQKVA